MEERLFYVTNINNKNTKLKSKKMYKKSQPKWKKSYEKVNFILL